MLPAVDALGAGALAGLGVALPLGAVGVLIVQEGIAGGWRPASAAATGVALVDGGEHAAIVARATTRGPPISSLRRLVGRRNREWPEVSPLLH